MRLQRKRTATSHSTERKTDPPLYLENTMSDRNHRLDRFEHADRIHRLAERQEAGRALLRWFGVVAAGTLVAALVVVGRAEAAPRAPAEEAASGAPAAARSAAAPVLMLRPGDWRQDPGSYVLPAALGAHPREWPTDGWYRVTVKSAGVQVQAVKTPAQGMPDFLREIALQVIDPASPPSDRGEAEAEAIDTRYLRVPGTALASGLVPAVAFQRGVLTPRLDHAYALSLGPQPFTLTVSNGLRNSRGVPYGDGAVYTVRMGEDSYSFHVQGGYGWETTVLLAADLDGDGRPDFVVQSGDHETLLLSSRARAGLNPPAAVLVTQSGC
jgi:hypothetical protein